MGTFRGTTPTANDKCYVGKSKGGYNSALVINNSNGLVLPNCVGYVHGRSMEYYGKNSCAMSCGNANTFYNYKDGYQRSSKAEVGSVICFAGGTAGHVAFVEGIDSNGNILISHSHYGGATYDYAILTKASGYKYGAYTCVGFIKPYTNASTQTTSQNTQRVLKAGDKFNLSNVPVYNNGTGKTIGNRTGTYYVWSTALENGRVRMTNSPTRVGVAGQVSFFVDVKSLK